MTKQLHQVNCSCNHYWGWPSCFPRNCLFLWSSLRTGRIRVHGGCPDGAEEITCNDLLGGLCLGRETLWLALLLPSEFGRYRRRRGAFVSAFSRNLPPGLVNPLRHFVNYYGLLMCSPSVRLESPYTCCTGRWKGASQWELCSRSLCFPLSRWLSMTSQGLPPPKLVCNFLRLLCHIVL